jgi:hypothetical protein
VVLMPISATIVVVVSSILVKPRASTTIMEVTLLHRLMVLASMVLSLSVFRLIHLAFQSYSLIKQGLKGRSISN